MCNSSKNKHYQIPRASKMITLIMLIVASASGILCVTCTYWNIGSELQNPKRLALFYGVLFSVCNTGYLWMFLTCYNKSLLITETTITQQNITRAETIHMAEISQVIWNRGYVLVQSSTQELKIRLTLQFNFTQQELLEIIQLIRNRIASEIQQNWLPADETGRWTLQDPPPGSQGFYMSLVILFCASAGLLTYLWSIEIGRSFWVIGLICLLFALWFLWKFVCRAILK